ncbi:MAG TPA: Na(+)/glucose symporter, partial [Syntrophomonas sp.]|nr:Na(+)/glucose symporter [Syntrophomonas sp.]
TGLILGILVWLHFGISIDSWFYGCIISLLFPIVMILLLNPFSKNRFNFTKLHFYRAK